MLSLLSVVSAFFLLTSMGALDIIDRSLYGEWAGKPGDKVTQSLHFLFIISCIFLFWWGTRNRLRGFNRVLPLAAAGLLMMSALWSVNSAETIKRGGEYLFVIVGTIGIVKSLDDEVLMALISFTAALSVIVSIILLFIAPHIVLMGDPAVLRGVFSHKNMLGQAMVAGVLAGLYNIRAGRRPRLLYILLTVLFTIVAFVSRSATSVLVIVTFFVLDILAAFYVRGGVARSVSMCLGVAVLAVFVFVVTNLEVVFDLFDKDPTLTGRTDLWPYVIDDIFQKPLLGWGFSAFWLPSTPAAMEIFVALGWYVPEAHNGMLELLLQTGAVGTAYFLFLFIRNVSMALRCISRPAKQIGVSALLFFVGIVVTAVSEAVLLDPNQISTPLFFMMGFMCEKALKHARQARSRSYGVRGRLILPATLGSSAPHS